MKKINLKDYYPYCDDLWVDVPDEVADCLDKCRKAEKAQRERISYNKAFFSLDCGDGIEGCALFRVESPEEVYFKWVDMKELKNAIDQLPAKQKDRFCKHCIEGISETKIADEEGVGVPAVSHSITKSRETLEKILKKGKNPDDFSVD